LAFYNIKIPL